MSQILSEPNERERYVQSCSVVTIAGDDDDDFNQKVPHFLRLILKKKFTR